MCRPHVLAVLLAQVLLPQCAGAPAPAHINTKAPHTPTNVSSGPPPKRRPKTWPGCKQPSHSQSNEEVTFLQDFYSREGPGVYVEIGALDGVRYTNTLLLSNCLGWHGLLIEANPTNYANLLHNLHRRPNATVIHSAVCETEVGGSVPFTQEGRAVATDLSHTSASFQKTWAKVNHPNKTVQVPCRPMRMLMHDFPKVDFFSLDVEGAELTVLETIDFERTEVDTFVIELDGHDKLKDAAVIQLLESRGYSKCMASETNPFEMRNTWFRRNGAACPTSTS